MAGSKDGWIERNSGWLSKNFPTQEIVEISLIENIQREDLNPVEEADGIQTTD